MKSEGSPSGLRRTLGPVMLWGLGVANAAEEARNPQRDVAIGFGAAITTLVALAGLVFFLSVGVAGWEAVVYEGKDLVRGTGGEVLAVKPGAPTSDSPLPLALGNVVPPGHVLYHLLVGVGLLGLVASFHGILLAAGRAVFALGREGYLPRILGTVHRRTRTPVAALLLNMTVGLVAIAFLDTNRLISLSVTGAAVLYVVSLVSLFRLRRTEPDLPRPWRAPLYPWLPLLALVLGAFSLVVIIYYNHLH